MISVSRRKFLVGLTAAFAATSVPAARLLKAAPTLKPLGDRTGYQFTVLPDPNSALELHKQRIPVKIEVIGDVMYPQVERTFFPTSFIPTHSQAVKRDADNVSFPTIDEGTLDLSSPAPVRANNKRSTPAWYIDNEGKLRQVGPGESRFIPGKGLLIEQASHNLLLYTDPVYEWKTQTLNIAPGEYYVSWYGKGFIRLDSEQVALAKPMAPWRLTYMPRKLSNLELIELTKS